MKKRGFTLAELLIVLGITGVIAAVVLPLAAGLLPDKNKMMYLKVYDELGRNISHIASDSSLFPVCINTGSENIGCQDHPLLNTVRPSSKKFDSSNYEGNKKLCNLLAFNMNAESTKCSDSSYSFDSSSFNSDFNTNKSFTTQNGMEWWIVPQVNTKGGGNAEYQTDIYVDVDSSDKSPNCIYDSESCKNPDRFKFLLAADGTVIPADPMGLMYIETRKSFLKNKNQKVSDTTIESNLTDKLKKFEYQPCIESHFIEAANDCVNGGGVWDNYTNTCTCANTEEYWDDSAKTCRNPRLECESAGNTWVDGVCKTPQQICTDAGNTWVDGVCKTPQQFCEENGMVWQDGVCKAKNKPKIQIELIPIRLSIFSSYDVKIPLGLSLRATKIGGDSSAVTAGIDVKQNGRTTNYTCTIPAGYSTCVSKVINTRSLPSADYYTTSSSWYPTLGKPYINSSGNYETVVYGEEAITKDGYWDASGWDFEITASESGNGSGQVSYSGLTSAIKNLTNYSGITLYEFVTYTRYRYYDITGTGREWYFIDFDCGTPGSVLPNDYGCYEIIPKGSAEVQNYR